MVNAGLQRIFGSCSWIKTHFFGNPGKEIVFFFFVVFWPLGGGIKHNLRLKAVEGAGNLKLLGRFRGMNLGGLPNSSGFG